MHNDGIHSFWPIMLQEEEKAKVQNELRILTERLNRLNDSLQRKIQARQEYEKTLQETEGAYNKVYCIVNNCSFLT